MMSVMESRSYRSIVMASQHISWFLSQLLRVRYSIRVHRPAGLFERDSAQTGARMGECCLILAPTHQTILDPWLLMSALPYRCARALIPVRALATQTFHGPFRLLTPIIKVIYWLEGVIELPPKDNGDGTLPEKLQGLLEALRQGDVVMIFPEGGIGTQGAPPVEEFAPGVVYLQRESGAPVLPIAVWMSEPGDTKDEEGRMKDERNRTGSSFFFRLSSFAWLRRRYAVEFGRPVRIPEHLDLEAGAEWLREQTLALYEQAKERCEG
jgi:1-acyl-sn-glycerol-3-phosphate acyltransferase